MVKSKRRMLPRRSSQVSTRVLFIAVGILALAAAANGNSEPLASSTLDPADFIPHYTRPTDIPAPDDNPITDEKAQLGKMLFFDPRFSASGTISCASCHNPSLGWEDGLPLGVGNNGGKLGRHTPTVLDLAWGGPMFWDGRADGLEAQAVGPMMSSAEMAGKPENVLATLNGVGFYRSALQRLFADGVNIANAAKLIATYERTLVSGVAPFDRYVSGDAGAISAAAKRGFVLFNTKAACAACHSGWRFTDDGFHDIGLAGDDAGRGALMPGIPVLDHAFKTPTLRNIDQRAPYMHDGSAPTLEAVVDHYDHGFVQRPSLSPEVHALRLTPDEKADLVAFMKTLTSEDAPVTLPILPH